MPRFKKGSKAAKRFMASIRKKRNTSAPPKRKSIKHKVKHARRTIRRFVHHPVRTIRHRIRRHRSSGSRFIKRHDNAISTIEHVGTLGIIVAAGAAMLGFKVPAGNAGITDTTPPAGYPPNLPPPTISGSDAITLHVYTVTPNGLSIFVNGDTASTAGTITHLTIYYGDGSSESHFFPFSHTYSTGGTYNLAVHSFDSTGASKIVTFSLIITAPTYTITAPPVINAPLLQPPAPIQQPSGSISTISVNFDNGAVATTGNNTQQAQMDAAALSQFYGANPSTQAQSQAAQAAKGDLGSLGYTLSTSTNSTGQLILTWTLNY
jgi:uncharacterized Zn-binding protein involved in type VI secretion